jgi:hypothetical protein
VFGPGELLDGNLLRAKSAGRITIEAFQSGDSNYEPASTQQTFVVFPAPELALTLNHGKLLLAWLDTYTGFQLETTTNLGAAWLPAIPFDSPQNRSELKIDGPSRFFRLKAQ